MVATALSNAYATDVDVDLAAGVYSEEAKTTTWTVGEDVTIVQNQGTSTSPVNSKYIALPRIYKGHYLSFTAAENIKITGVEITYDGKYMGNDIVAGTEEADDVVTADAAIVSNISTDNGSTHTFTCDAGVSIMYIQNTGATENVQLRPTAIKVIYESATPDPFVQQTITALDQLSNRQAYIIRDADGEGTVVYNPALSETNLMIAGSNNAAFPPAKEEYKADVDLTNANNAWQIVNIDDAYYLYNIGAKRFAASTGQAYFFTETPTAIELTVREDGTFNIRTAGTGSTSYMCIAAGNGTAPVAFWTADDHGSILTIETADVKADATVENSIKAYLEQQVLNEEYAAAYAELGTLLSEQMQKNTTGTTPLITDVSQLSSPYTEPKEGSLAGLIDGDAGTFWHSAWSAGDVANGVHYLEIGFAEEISGVVQLSLTRRNVANDHLTLASIRGVKDGVETELAKVSLPYGTAGEMVSAYFAFAEGQDTLRIYELVAVTNRGYWHAAELQLNKVSMDASIEAKMIEAYAAYSNSYSEGNATQEQVDALKAEVLGMKVIAGSAIEAGTYLIAANIDGQLRAAVALDEGKSYGYPAAVDATLENDKVITEDEPQPFTFIAAEGGFLIKDVHGRYVYLSGNYNSINVNADVPAEGAVWTVTTNEDGTVNIYNNDKKKLMQYDTQYSNFSFLTAIKGQLPALYRDYASSTTTGIVDVNVNTTDDLGVTLQGIKASKDTRGIIIRGGKKIVVK